MASAPVLLPGEDAFVPVRAVSPPESPFEGTLARDADGREVLLVDRDLLAEWPGWAAHDDHVLAPLDVSRRADGHDVVLPALAERLDRLVDRRHEMGAPMGQGEVVTAAVSVLRGLRAVLRAEHTDGVAQWWLTDEGRPVLVQGAGDEPARPASAAVLAALAASLPTGVLADRVGEIADAVADEGVRRRELGAREDALFALAVPEPIAMQIMAPLRRRTRRSPEQDSATQTAATRAGATRTTATQTTATQTTVTQRAMTTALTEAHTEGADRAGLWRRLASHLDADLADAASDALHRVWRGMRRRVGARPRPAVLAGVLAVAVLTVGLLWPQADDPARAGAPAPSSAADAPASESAASTAPPVETPSPPAVDATEAATEPATETEAAEARLHALLERRRQCADPSCLAEVLEDPSRQLPAGAIDADAARRSIRIVDDLGGLVVLSVQAPSLAEQLVTIVGANERWRIRDAYVVADPPS